MGALLLLLAPSSFAQVSDWREIKVPPLNEFTIQQPTKITLPNGMVVMLQEDHELPLVSGYAVIRGGARDVPAAKTGLTGIYGEVWRTGGTTKQTGDQLDDLLESRAAKIETGADIDSTSISFNALKEDFDPVFDLFVDLLRNPAFREDKIVIAKNQQRTGIARRNDNPMQIAGREAVKIAYGIDSPYARVPEYYTVDAVTREDLVQWHKRHVHPNNIILGITGDFDSKKMEQRIRKAFRSWERGPAVSTPEVKFQEPKADVYFVPKDDINQSSIRMIALGTTRDNPDYYALQVLNEVLAGGFSSRLFSNIRSKKGLAYSVGGGIGTEFDRPGIFMLSMGTKSETTAAAIDALQEELKNIVSNPPDQQELDRAKESILNSFIFRFDSKEKLLNEQLSLAFYNYPSDFYTRFRDAVEKVTPADIAQVAKKYIKGDNMAILVVGKAADFDRPLSSFGQVTTLDITIPEAPPGEAGATPAAAATGNDKGRQLAQKVTEAYGGQSKVASVKSILQKGKVMMQTPQGEIPITVESITVFPDRAYQKMMTPMGEMVMVASPSASFMSGAMGSRDLPASQKEEQLKEIYRDPFFILQHAGDPDVTFTSAGSEKIGDIDAQIVDVNSKGAEVRWYVDPASGRILRSSNRAMTPTGPATQVKTYSDWRMVDGISLPFHSVVTVNGEESGKSTTEEIVINPQVDSKLFEKPAA